MSRIVSQVQTMHDGKATPRQVQRQRFANGPQSKQRPTRGRGRPKGKHTHAKPAFRDFSRQEVYNASAHRRTLDHFC